MLAPVPFPTSCRDGYAFRQHVAAARRNRKVEMIPEFDQYPIFYFTNHHSIQGPGEVRCMPDHFEKLDFELEAAIVICKHGRNIKAEQADEYIGGLMIMNDMSARRLTTKGTANKLGVTIPLNATAMAVLMEIKGNPVRHLVRVFTYEGKPLADYGKAWNKALKRAGIEGFTWHGLRHTFNSWFAQAGVPEDIRKQVCG